MAAPLLLVEDAGKKFCKSLRRSLLYGMSDIARNLAGLSSRPGKLRKDEFWAVDGVRFELRHGETLGIIGPNGAGKSTLLKMLNGIFWPDKGKITVRGKVGALIEVGAGFHPLLTGRENIFVNGAILGMTRREIAAKFDRIVEFAGIGDFLDSPVKSYSSGMFVRLGFAIAVHSEPEILLIDEVLAVGDKGFQGKCFNAIGKLKKTGTATILVSHNTHQIENFADRILLLKKGQAALFTDVQKALDEYSDLFRETSTAKIQPICSGNERIAFKDVLIGETRLQPGDAFEIALGYHSLIDYDDVYVDIGIYTESEQNFYFQASNKTYAARLDLKKGAHRINVSINAIPLNGVNATIALAIWSNDKSEKLFWWRIPVHFSRVRHTQGKNFLHVRFSDAAPRLDQVSAQEKES
jgi:lipopolysaccharide transport system ATP-binding protein